jgi:hypothetical protein
MKKPRFISRNTGFKNRRHRAELARISLPAPLDLRSFVLGLNLSKGFYIKLTPEGLEIGEAGAEGDPVSDGDAR